MNKGKKKKGEKPAKILTLDTETRGLFGEVFRVGLYDGSMFYAADSFNEIKHVILHYTTTYSVHVYIHNLDFDLSKIAEDVLEGIDFENSLFIQNNVTVFSTYMQMMNEQGEEPIRRAPVTFHDSLKVLPGSLANLCESFGLGDDERKIDLSDHIKARGWAQTDQEGNFDKEASLNYYFHHVEPDEEQLNIYLEYDCKSLHTLLTRAIELSNLDDEEFVQCPTAASLAMRVYKEVWNGDYETACTGNFRGDFGGFVESFIRGAYYGGRTEVFKPELIDGYHYDVNSLYPYVMKAHTFPVGWYDHYRGQAAKEKLAFWLMFGEGGGFAEIDIHVPEDLHIPPLPSKRDKKLLFPVGDLSGTWAFPEIALAIQYGCTINAVHQVIYFQKMKPIFRDFVSYWEEVKTTSHGAKREFSKLMQNSLYGKFGMQRKRRTLLALENRDKLEEDGEMYIVRHHPLLKEDFIEAETITHAAYIQPQIAAYVTAYARIHLYKQLMDKTSGEKYYCDTDSIVCKKPFEDDLVDKTAYGKWDLENVIREGVYIQPKMYMEKTADGKLIRKAKGVPKSEMPGLTETRYKEILSEIKNGADRVELYEGVRKNKKFVTKLKNGESFNRTENVKKGINLRAQHKRKMDYLNNQTSPHPFYDFGPKKDQLDLEDWKRDGRAAYEKMMLDETAYDDLKEKVREHGYIRTMQKGDYYFAEYQDFSRSIKMKYFRKKGEPIDSWCDASGLDVNDVLEQLGEE